MKRVKRIYILLTISFLVVLGFSSCRDFEKEMQEEEQALIQAYIKNNNVTVEPTASGLYFLEITPGTGPMPIIGDSVGVYYKTKLLNGYILDQVMNGKPAMFKVGHLIQGMNEGIILMRQYGKAKLLMPSSLAYGRMGYGMVSGYTPLVFEVEIVTVKPGLLK